MKSDTLIEVHSENFSDAAEASPFFTMKSTYYIRIEEKVHVRGMKVCNALYNNNI